MCASWIIAVILILSYLFLVTLFLYGWYKIKVYRNENTATFTTFVSIIIPVRNEEENITGLLSGIKCQDYPQQLFEAIVVDDASTDNTVAIVENICNKSGNIRLVKMFGELTGKKNALAMGIKSANGKLIVTTDGDCCVNKKWISTIVAFYEKYSPQMIIVPVALEQERTGWHKMQSLEFLSLIGSGAGAAGIDHAIMCNGANLAYEKEALVNNMKDDKFVSGDDVLLMLQLKKKNCKIRFLKSNDAIVFTKPQETLTGFMNQRLRWTSKSRAFRDGDVIATAVIVFAYNAGLLFFLVGAALQLEFIGQFFALFIAKMLADLVFLNEVTSFFNKKKLLIYFLPVQCVYPFYIILTAVLGNIMNFTWKGRTHRSVIK